MHMNGVSAAAGCEGGVNDVSSPGMSQIRKSRVHSCGKLLPQKKADRSETRAPPPATESRSPMRTPWKSIEHCTGVLIENGSSMLPPHACQSGLRMAKFS